MPGEALCREDRDEIARELARDPKVEWTELAGRVGVHRTTVMREVERNGGRGSYGAAAAQQRADTQRCRARPSVLVTDAELGARVTAELRECRSPAAIAADLRAEGGPSVCTETIYRAVYGNELDVKARDCLRRRRPRRRKRQARVESKRPGLANIATRPAAINGRGELGHWEADLIIGARNQSGVLTMIERTMRYGRLVDLPEGYSSEAVLAALVEVFEVVPEHLRGSVTFDQGSEWAEWQTLAATYDLSVYFCDPHSPWQRGAIENFNGHTRFWLPRGTRLDIVGADELARVEALLNNQRRRVLDWESPAALYKAATGC